MRVRENNHSCDLLSLSCLQAGLSETTCQQRTKTFIIKDIREDDNVSCADRRRPVRVLLDLILKRKGREDILLPNSSYCCDNKFKGKSRILRIDKYCCGTGFSVCDDLPKQYRRYPIKLKCCGDDYSKQNLESNCRDLVPSFPLTSGAGSGEERVSIYDLQNSKYLAAKTNRSISDIQPIPNPVDHGYGFCSYARSGRYDVTKDLSRNTGSDILALCREGKVRKGKEKGIQCPANKKVMYQFQSSSNICCTRGWHMHVSEEDDIHRDCCINNFAHPDKLSYLEEHPASKYKSNYCKRIPNMSCCSGTCFQDPTCLQTSGSDCSEFRHPALCTVNETETVVNCDDDFLFDLIDDEYAKASSK